MTLFISILDPETGMLSYLNAGDQLFIYSDGLEDVKNAGEEFFGSERLLASFRQKDANVETILGQIEQFMGKEAQYDDLTLLILDRE